jgi:hypothetical protein
VLEVYKSIGVFLLLLVFEGKAKEEEKIVTSYK